MYKKISLLTFSLLLTLQASAQLVKINIDKEMIKTSSYNDIHLLYNNKLTHIYNRTKYIKVETKNGLAKKVYVLKNGFGLYEDPKLTYFNYIFEEETEIKINLKTTIAALMIEAIGVSKIYNIGAIEAKNIIGKYVKPFLSEVNIKINSDKDIQEIMINKESLLLKYAHLALKEINEEIDINKTVEDRYLELNEIEPLNTKMYIKSTISEINKENFIYLGK